MGTISSGATGLPPSALGAAAVPGSGASGLSPEATDRLLMAGIPQGAIEVANNVVGGVGTQPGYSMVPGGLSPAPSMAPGAAQTPATMGAPGISAEAMDQPDPQYPGLLQSHVLLLRAVATNDLMIGQLASMNVNYGEMDQWIQANIMANPEWWDSVNGNVPGTARQGLQELMPTIQLPPPGMPGPAYVPGVPSGPTDPQGSFAPSVPGWSGTPGMLPGAVPGQTPGLPGWAKAGLGLAAMAGVGLLAWKAGRGRAPSELAHVAEEGAQTLGFAGAGPEDALRGVAVQAALTPGVHGGGPAMVDGIRRNLLVGNEFLMQAGNAAVNHGMPAETGMRYAVMHELAKNPSVGQFLGAAKEGDDLAKAVETLGKLARLA